MATVPFVCPGYDAGVIVLRRRAAPLLLAIAVLSLAAACGGSTSPAPASARPTAVLPDPSLTAVPGGLPTPIVGATVGPPITNDSAIGPIFDRLPSSFPIPAGAIRTDAREPVSGSFALGMSISQAAETVGNSLRAQGWSVDVGSALEDGSVVIDVGGAQEGCVAEVRLTPLSGTVSMSVLYGASCPFD
jgi:hypothetical protein